MFLGILMGAVVTGLAAFTWHRRLMGRLEHLNHSVRSLNLKLEGEAAEKFNVSAILENMIEGVLAVDKNRRICIMNPMAEKMCKISREQAKGRSLLEIIKDPTIDTITQTAIETASVVSKEIELIHEGRRIFHVSAAGLPAGEGMRAVLVLYDVTELKRLEKVRRDFVANVSHEFRTPLTSIKGFIETLLDGALSDTTRAKEFLKIMQGDSERLERLTDDLLSLSRIEVLNKPPRSVEVDLHEIFLKTLELFAQRLNTQKIKIENHIPKGPESIVKGDPDQLTQVVTNLLDNAIKFGKWGGLIILELKKMNGKAQVSIQDDGIGIPQDDLPRIFERFFRVDKARVRQTGGTGLGLSIVKHIIDLHGGEISCESRLGEGSKFIFTLPA